VITHAVVRICCDRADGVEYFASYDEAAFWRREFENRDSPSHQHHRTGVLLKVSDAAFEPPRVGMEDQEYWAWLGEHWEIRDWRGSESALLKENG
jgi:hypothetical protein